MYFIVIIYSRIFVVLERLPYLVRSDRRETEILLCTQSALHV